MTVAAVLLALLGLSAVAIVLNARDPHHAWWNILVRWPWSWAARELTPLLVVVWALAGGVLVALGGLEHVVGSVGGVLLLAALAIGVAWSLTARGARISVAGQVADLDLDDPDDVAPGHPRVPRSHVAFPLLMFRPRGVRHERGVPYTDDGERPRRLDVYLPAEDPAPGVLRPAIVQVHGGAWVVGSRKEQGIPLLNHLARCGWVGVNVDYRLSPFATWPEHVVDVKRAIAWVRENAERLAVDPTFVALTGGSAGGHICAFTALVDDPALQPGFEDADCTVQAAVPFYGVYDLLDEPNSNPLLHPWIVEPMLLKARRERSPEAFRAASPTTHVHPGAPPFLVVHGDADSLIPVGQARAFVERLRATSTQPVAYLELKGGEHAFDLIPSWRTAPVVETIERFLRVTERRRHDGATRAGDAVMDALTD